MHKGRRQISDLSPALRKFVEYEFSMLWRDVKRTNAAHILHTVPPFRLVNVKTHELLPLHRLLREEDGKRLIFERTDGTTRYKITLHDRSNGNEYLQVEGRMLSLAQFRHNKRVWNEAKVMVMMERWTEEDDKNAGKEYKMWYYG